MVVERAKTLKLGDGLELSTEVGPLINEGQRNIVESYVKIGNEEGAKMLCGGEVESSGDCARGWFYKPTVFDGMRME